VAEKVQAENTEAEKAEAEKVAEKLVAEKAMSGGEARGPKPTHTKYDFYDYNQLFFKLPNAECNGKYKSMYLYLPQNSGSIEPIQESTFESLVVACSVCKFLLVYVDL
jgi:hypothetical protein